MKINTGDCKALSRESRDFFVVRGQSQPPFLPPLVHFQGPDRWRGCPDAPLDTSGSPPQPCPPAPVLVWGPPHLPPGHILQSHLGPPLHCPRLQHALPCSEVRHSLSVFSECFTQLSNPFSHLEQCLRAGLWSPSGWI